LRFFKVILAIFLVIIIILSSVFFTRSSVVTSVVNDYLTQHNSTISCIDFTVNADFDLVIAKLCIDSPYAEVELIDTLIEWRFKPSHLQGEELEDAISAIRISSANVRAKTNIQFTENTSTAKLPIRTLPRLIRQQLQDAALLSTPVELDIQSIVYQPYSEHTDNKSQLYLGQFLVTDEQLLFTLATPKKADVFSIKVAKKSQDFNVNISVELARLKTFLQSHKAILPVELAELLVNENRENWSISGQIESQITWHEQVLTMSNQLSDFSLKAEQALTQNSGFTLDASLAWRTILHDEIVQIDFKQGNKLNLTFDQPALIQLLTEKSVDVSLVDFLTHNAMSNLHVEPVGSLKIDVDKQTIHSDGIVLNSQNLHKPVKISLNKMSFDYRDELAISANLLDAGFSFSGPIKLAQLSPFTQQPVMMNIVGAIKQQPASWQLTLAPTSAIELSQLTFPLANNDSNAQVTNKKTQPSVKTLLSHWQGTVTIPKSNEQGKNIDVTEVNFDLHSDNQLKQFNVPKLIQAKSLELNSKLSGSLADIAIGANIIVDKIAIASAKISGDIFQPNIEVSAKDVVITDLLALNIAPPIELKLIDGMLNYHLSGHIKNTTDLMGNSMKLSLSLKDVTGEVEGTWLQELNWQQKFTLKNDQIKSQHDGLKTENNLTIAKIETATPISNLSTMSLISFEQNELNIEVKNTSGHLLGGRFDIPHAQWPFIKETPLELKLTKIDLEKLLELDKKQGIVVTGRVSGVLPIYSDGEHFLVKDGDLHNVGDGLIQVFNNPAVEELKISSTELKLAFDALENLHYHHLSSEVSMADDGYMLLITAIKGRNPDLDNDVNLNLNLSYDLLGLLESLNITEHLESKVIKGLQH
jgi:hypothetical protein